MFGLYNAENSIKSIIKNDEHHQIGKKVISGYDLLAINYREYLKKESYLNPLIEALSKKMHIVNITYNTMEDGFSVVIEYLHDGNKGIIILKNDEVISDDNLEFVIDGSDGLYHDTILKNKKLIIKSFNKAPGNILTNKQFHSTSKLFEISVYDSRYQIVYHNVHNIYDCFKLSIEHNLLNRDGDIEKIIKYMSCSTTLENLKNCFEDEDNIRKFLQHVKVYDSDVQKVLVKK